MHFRRVACGVWAVLLTLLGMSTSGMAVADSKARRLDVGGYALHIDCQGRGSPTVVLDAGLGDAGIVWRQVQSGLEPRVRVCFYDRAGYGDSDPGPPPRTSGRLAAELHALLARAHIPPPYVLVGHSFGGYNMRLFASLYPQDTVGLVLVDTPHENQIDGFLHYALPGAVNPQAVLQQFWRPEWIADVSIEDLQPLARLIGKEPKTLYAIMGELAAYHASEKEVRAADIPAALPLIIIMHGQRIFPPGAIGDRLERDWLELQRQLASRYKTGTIIIADKSGHNIHFSEPDVVVMAVSKLLDNLGSAKKR